jgi:signal transduction histidine kinase
VGPRPDDLGDPSTGVTARSEGPVDMVRALAALCRFVVVLRLAAIVTLAAGASLVTERPWLLAAAAGLATAVSVAELLVLSRRPVVVSRPLLLLALDLGAGAAMLALTRADPVYFSFSCVSAALAGALYGRRSAPLWVLQTLVGYVVVADVLRAEDVPPSLAVHLTGIPALYVLAGLAAASARAAVIDHVRLARTALAAIERTAIASERGRMARELHDSFAQTLKGLSFAAYALPSSLHRSPSVATELAASLARAAEEAAAEAREVLEALRADDTDVPFDRVVADTCAQWSARSGLAVHKRLSPVDVGIEVRHELLRILREALGNAHRHSRAGRVTVTLAAAEGEVVLVVTDDGIGFAPPVDLHAFAATGHYGLIGIEERAARAGGRLMLRSAPGAGTELTAVVPAAHRPATAAVAVVRP